MSTDNMDQKGFIPGTVHLVDVEGTMKAKHLNAGKGDIVLVPTPSSDPNDPLNWTPRRKLLHCVSLQVYTLMVGIASAAIYSVIVPISEATGLSVATLNEGVFDCSSHLSISLMLGRNWLHVFALWMGLSLRQQFRTSVG